MTLHNDVTRCTGEMHTPSVAWVTACPARDNCQRYTDKPTNPEYTPMMNAPKIRKSGCELKIRRNDLHPVR